MVDKMHLKPWQWRIGAGVAAAAATAGTWTAMAYIAIVGLFTQCGFEELPYEDGSAREAVCQSAVVPTIGAGALAYAPFPTA
jgi:hypothetical protein